MIYLPEDYSWAEHQRDLRVVALYAAGYGDIAEAIEESMHPRVADDESHGGD